MRSQSFGFGIDQIVRGHARLPSDRRYGLLTNDAARTADAPHTTSRQALLLAGVPLARLFSPEHGIGAAADDGAIVPDGVDPTTQLEVVSLYGERMRPERAMLDGLDAVLIDLPDIGARFYTFIWSMSYMLEACAEARIPVWILDRPNPIGGDLAMAEGPMLDVHSCASFLGRHPVPIRHSLTIGELARLWNDEQRLQAEMHVVPAVGWKRSDHQPATGAPFVPTSPAMSRYAGALFYPGICLFEATNVSVGRGTRRPFEQIGAPWLDAAALHAAFAGLKLPGVASEPVSFTPSIPPHSGQRCHGIRLKIIAPKSLRPVELGLLLLAIAIEHAQGAFQWLRYPTAANPQGDRHFELLVGRCDVVEMLENRHRDLRQRIQSLIAVPDWQGRVQPHLIYSDAN